MYDDIWVCDFFSMSWSDKYEYSYFFLWGWYISIRHHISLFISIDKTMKLYSICDFSWCETFYDKSRYYVIRPMGNKPDDCMWNLVLYVTLRISSPGSFRSHCNYNDLFLSIRMNNDVSNWLYIFQRQNRLPPLTKRRIFVFSVMMTNYVFGNPDDKMDDKLTDWLPSC